MKNPWDQRLGVWWIAEDHPDLPAVVESPSGISLTFAELTGRAHQVVHALRARGCMVGDVFAYVLPNDVDMIVWQLAAMEGGLRSVALNPALSASEMSTILEHSNVRCLVAHARYADVVAQVTTPKSLHLRVAIGGCIEAFESIDEFLAGRPVGQPSERRLGGPLTYSSGTTGKPKGIWRDIPPVDPSSAADMSKIFGRAFSFMPLKGAHLVSAGMHHGGCQGFYHGALNVGQALAIMDRFDAEEALRIIERRRVSTAYMVPTQFVRLLRLPADVRARYDHSSLEVVVHSAAPCSPEIKRQMFEWWGPVIWETYGGSEGAATIAKPNRWLEKPGTVGRAVRGMSVKILDDDGNEVAVGEAGHVFLESVEPQFEYLNDPELTASVHRGRAFTIGDIGYLDEDGYLFLCDRAKDMIIIGGANVYPAEVEGVLTAHPSVADVAVVGIPDDEWGEQVKAIVELVATVEPTPHLVREMIAFARDRLAGYKCPRTVDFRKQLPRTDGGKLHRRLLRDEYWSRVGRKL